MINDEVYLHYVHMIFVIIVKLVKKLITMILHNNHGSISTSLRYVRYQRVLFIYFLYMKEFGDHYAISPSFHRVLYHFIEFLDFFQSQGISIGELSEQAIEASNYDSKQNVLKHSYRGSYVQQNLDCFRKSWWVSDPYIMY